ncbi:hypothetical protein Fcan01_10531 [Folsomia candida]|uniref:Uncharacterized protein n=1 Tax=Folsomia candida TaxID=158441 RepID=A0A226E9C9_FOLCA|nr:hypothetical protein Fcan01_10531 [Folsomia candida]
MPLLEMTSPHWTTWLHPTVMQTMYSSVTPNKWEYSKRMAKNVFAIWVTIWPKDRFNPPLKLYFLNLAVAFIIPNSLKLEICTPRETHLLVKGSYDVCKQTETPDVLVDTMFSWVRQPKEFCYQGFDDINYSLISSSQQINPFSTKTNRSFEVLAQIVFRHGNVSLIPAPKRNIPPILEIRELYDENVEITVKFTGLEFLTCYKESSIDFQFYITPFQPALWAGLAVSVASIVSVTLLALYCIGMHKVLFSPWLFILATLFEEAPPIPGQIEKLSWLRMIFGSWCLMTVILTNCYSGLMITELNAPFKSYTKETFPDLSCGGDYEKGVNSNSNFLKDVVPYYKAFGQYIDFVTKENLLMILNIGNAAKNEACFSLLSLTFEALDEVVRVPEFLLDLKENTPLNRISENVVGGSPLSSNEVINTFTPEEISNLNLLHPKHPHFPISIYSQRSLPSYSEFQKIVESEIVSCGRSVFIAESDYLAAEFEFLSRNYFWIKFTRGKQVRHPVPFGVIFSGEVISKIPGYYRILFETGIYQRIEVEMRVRKWAARQPVGERREEKPAMMELDGGILTPFVICSAVLLGAIVCFLVESWKQFVQVFKYVMRVEGRICKNSCPKCAFRCGNHKLIKVRS